jgi:hypothetical protein
MIFSRLTIMEQEGDSGHGILNYRFAMLTKKTVPEKWDMLMSGKTLAFINPEYPEVLNAWKRKHTIAKGATTTINHLFSLTTTADGSDGKKTTIQAITRLPTPDISALEEAARKGVRIEKPLAVIYDGKSLPISVFEHVEGSTLNQFLEKVLPNSDENIKKRMDAIRGTLTELEKLHKIKFQHGDAAGKNIIVSPEGVVLIDVTPNMIVQMAKKGQMDQRTKRLASKPHIEDFSRLYASIRDIMTPEEKALFAGKTSDNAVKFHANQLRNIYDGKHYYNAELKETEIRRIKK